MRRGARDRLVIVSPAAPGTTSGNSVTADRYARIFRSLGWNVRILGTYAGEVADVLVALHAYKSASSVLSFRSLHPTRPIILVLTGTDLYRDIARSRRAQKALATADRIVVLQPDGLRHLAPATRAKATAIMQSAKPCAPRTRPPSRIFTICVLGHLRLEKDPMRAAYAVRYLDSRQPLCLIHAGKILSEHFARATAREMLRNPRYHFLGELPRSKARQVLRQSDLLIQSSRMEGGANVLSEAIACGVPIVASRVSGNVGILGRAYPGLYRAGDTRALARMIERSYASPEYYKKLLQSCAKLRGLTSPVRELAAWARLLERAR